MVQDQGNLLQLPAQRRHQDAATLRRLPGQPGLKQVPHPSLQRLLPRPLLLLQQDNRIKIRKRPELVNLKFLHNLQHRHKNIVHLRSHDNPLLLQRHSRRHHKELPRQEETRALPGVHLPHIDRLQVVEEHLAAAGGIRMPEGTVAVMAVPDYMY